MNAFVRIAAASPCCFTRSHGENLCSNVHFLFPDRCVCCAKTGKCPIDARGLPVKDILGLIVSPGPSLRARLALTCTCGLLADPDSCRLMTPCLPQVDQHFCSGTGKELLDQLLPTLRDSAATSGFELRLSFVGSSLGAPAAAAPVAFRDKCRDLYQEGRSGGAQRRFLDTTGMHGLRSAELEGYQHKAAAALATFEYSSFSVAAACNGGRLRAALRLSSSKQVLPRQDLITSNDWMDFEFVPVTAGGAVAALHALV